jgi:hypothetical protein
MMTSRSHCVRTEPASNSFVLPWQVGAGVILKVLLLWFFYMPPMNMLLFLGLLAMAGYDLIKALLNIRRRAAIRYAVTAVALVLIVLAPGPVLQQELVIERYRLEFAPQRAVYEEQVAKTAPDKDGIKRAQWLLSSWWGEQVYFLYDDSGKSPGYHATPEDPCHKTVTKLTGNFYLSAEGC